MPNPLRAARLATRQRQQERDGTSTAYRTTTPTTIPTAVTPPPLVVSPPFTTAPDGRDTTGFTPRTPQSPMAPSPGIPYYQEQGLTAADQDRLSFARMANALLPYFSAQDQQTVSTFLNTQDPNGLFKSYLGNLDTPSAQRVDNRTSRGFSSATRAQDALTRLDTMRQTANLTEEQLGSGYKFLKQAIGILSRLGINSSAGENGMTRKEYEDLQAQLAALKEQGESDPSLAPYADLATKFINPTLIGSLFPKSVIGGNPVYGQVNRKLF